MSLVVNTPSADCSGRCDQCGLTGGGPLPAGDSSVRGGLMVFCSAVVFILPLLSAAAGAFLARRTALMQVGGAAAGFALGVLMAKGFTALLKVGEKK